MSARSLILLASLLSVSCYESHGLEGPRGDAGRDCRNRCGFESVGECPDEEPRVGDACSVSAPFCLYGCPADSVYGCEGGRWVPQGWGCP